MITLFNQKQHWKVEGGSENSKRMAPQNYFPFFVILFFHLLVPIVRWGGLKVPTDNFYPKLLFGGRDCFFWPRIFLESIAYPGLAIFSFAFSFMLWDTSVCRSVGWASLFLRPKSADFS
ncbi:MAG TPA: hypothetical protein DD618_02845 [Acholeplasmatales bacterium]|nr:hypothetical protein [Acholeplasmatales bacterium]